MNTYKQNSHTQTTYCDGKNAPEEMVQKAIELRFDTLGFFSVIHIQVWILKMC